MLSAGWVIACSKKKGGMEVPPFLSASCYIELATVDPDDQGATAGPMARVPLWMKFPP